MLIVNVIATCLYLKSESNIFITYSCFILIPPPVPVTQPRL